MTASAFIVWHLLIGRLKSSLTPGKWIDMADLRRIPLTTITKKALAARLSKDIELRFYL